VLSFSGRFGTPQGSSDLGTLYAPETPRGRKPKRAQKKEIMKPATFLPMLLSAFIINGFAQSAFALTSTDAANILFIKQEEKLARDAYLTLNGLWSQATFDNIAVSEQRHMDAVDGLIARYQLTDTTPEEIGKFTIPELQDLYDELIEFGIQSLENALMVGVMIEETDIEDLSSAIATTQEKPIRNVYTNLLEGSENHLDAFVRALEP
jgi:hypothetical protein